VRALEPLPGLRVVAAPDAIDLARWVPGDAAVLRFAPDDAFAIGARAVEIGDVDAIVEPEPGFVGAWLTPGELLHSVLPAIEWSLPTERPALAQGTIGGVPAKLWLTRGQNSEDPADAEGSDGADRALLVVLAAYADDLAGRLR
jgi:hypothetical protein